MTSAMAWSDARPRDPLSGSLTSMTAAPPCSAAAASATDRTLTSNSAMRHAPTSPFDRPFLDLKKTHPARIGPEWDDTQVGKHESVQNRALEPRGFVEVPRTVRREVTH